MEVAWEAGSQGVNEKDLRRCASFVSHSLPLEPSQYVQILYSKIGLMFVLHRDILTLQEGSYNQSHSPLPGGGEGCLSQRLM